MIDVIVSRDTFVAGEIIHGEVISFSSQPTKAPKVTVHLVGGFRANPFCIYSTYSKYVNDATIPEIKVLLTELSTTISPTSVWEPSKRIIPFNIEIPDQAYTPSFERDSFSLQYVIQTTIEYPEPGGSSWEQASSSYTVKPEITYDRLAKAARSLSANSVTMKVAVCDENSLNPRALLLYAIGRDTAKAWFTFSLELKYPDFVILCRNDFYKMSEGCKLSIIPTSNLGTDVIMRQLVIDIKTTVEVSEPKFASERVYHTRVLKSDHPPMSINSGAAVSKAIDLSHLLYGAEIPGDWFPSMDARRLKIRHTLVFRIKLKAKPFTKVNQVSAVYYFRIPLQVSHNSGRDINGFIC